MTIEWKQSDIVRAPFLSNQISHPSIQKQKLPETPSIAKVLEVF